jgi:hypothetical protein
MTNSVGSTPNDECPTPPIPTDGSLPSSTRFLFSCAALLSNRYLVDNSIWRRVRNLRVYLHRNSLFLPDELGSTRASRVPRVASNWSGEKVSMKTASHTFTLNVVSVSRNHWLGLLPVHSYPFDR